MTIAFPTNCLPLEGYCERPYMCQLMYGLNQETMHLQLNVRWVGIAVWEG